MFRTFKSGVLYRHLWQTFHHPVSRTWRHISAATVVHCLILWLSHRWIKTKNLTSKMSYWKLCSLASSFGVSRRGAVWEQQQNLLVGNICPSRSSVRTGPTGVMMGGKGLIDRINLISSETAVWHALLKRYNIAVCGNPIVVHLLKQPSAGPLQYSDSGSDVFVDFPNSCRCAASVHRQAWFAQFCPYLRPYFGLVGVF